MSEFMTLDGIMEAPGAEPHPDGKNGWALRTMSDDQEQFQKEQAFSTGAFLLGRVTYQIWAAFWPTGPNPDGLADRINAAPKYVVSRTLNDAEWNNSTVIKGNVAQAIAELKEQDGEDIVLYGSADLLNSLVPTNLIDEFRIMVYPVLLGSGKRLFKPETDVRHLRLTGSKTFDSGAVLLTYHPEAEAPTSRFTEDFAWTQEQIRSLEAAQNADRILATVLFTDIVDSTARAASVGDKRWRSLLDRHDRIAHSEVERLSGRVVKTTGDGILATFDSPTRALRSAFGMSEALSQADLPIRAAIHTGEVELRQDDVGGIAVHIASRALAQAGEREVIVTRTVRDLATGIDLVFKPLGPVDMKGVPGQWELFSASAESA